MKSILVVFVLLAVVCVAANQFPQWQEEKEWEATAGVAVASQFQGLEHWRGFRCTLRLSYSADGEILLVGSDDPDSIFCIRATSAGVRAADAHIIPLAPARLRNYASGADHWTDVDFSL